jgi:hypothetical protein
MKQNLFNSIKLQRPNKNVFDLSHDVKLSLDMGKLVPTLMLECVPGDTFNISCESLLRLAPMVAPMMHRVDVTMHYFFVPNRILWPDWQDFITGGKNGTSEPEFPYFNSETVNDWIETLNPTTQIDIRKFLDYVGVPYVDNAGEAFNFSAMPFAAYQCIYNEYYRDQNLMNPVPFELESGNVGTGENLMQQRYRAWEHDYFTASLPWAQRGPSVDVPLGNITTPYTLIEGINSAGNPNVEATSGTYPVGDAPAPLQPGLYVPDLTAEVEPTTINTLRRAFKLQEWLEKNARGGARYIENILAHFGVKSSDARLQRPEYITGVKTPVVVSEVLNTTGIDGELPQGNMSGHGISVTTGNYGKYYCEEHGYIVGIMSVIPKAAYQQGLHKSFSKFDKLDYFWPSFAHIGEQEVKNQEIYLDGNDKQETFGYVPRYAEYKYLPSRVCADFRTTLNSWHMGRIFEEQPTLSGEFVECKPTKRIFAVTEEGIDSLYCHIYHKIKAIRPMPKFGTPMF